MSVPTKNAQLAQVITKSGLDVLQGISEGGDVTTLLSARGDTPFSAYSGDGEPTAFYNPQSVATGAIYLDTITGSLYFPELVDGVDVWTLVGRQGSYLSVKDFG